MFQAKVLSSHLFGLIQVIHEALVRLAINFILNVITILPLSTSSLPNVDTGLSDMM